MKSETPLTEFVQYQTEDKMLLHALLWLADEASRALVIYVPGMTGGFAGPHNLNPFVESIIKDGYGVLAVNMRTAGLQGMLFARFEDYVKDIAAAVAFAKSRGFTDVALVGDSLGGPRSIHYWYATREPSVRALVFMGAIISPYQEAQLRWNDKERGVFDAFLQNARDLVTQNKGHEILTYQDWAPGRPVTLSAQTLVDIFGIPAESDASTVKFGPHVTIPALVIHGTKDQIALPANAEAIYESLTAAPRRDLVWVESGHFFFTPHDAKNYATALTDWLNQVMPAYT